MAGTDVREGTARIGVPAHGDVAATCGTRLALLGGFALTVRGRHVALPHSAERLVAFLALHRRRMSRSYVAGALWPDVTEERAFACLRSALWRARLPGTALVDATRTGLALAADLVVDIEGVQDLLRRLSDPDEPTRPDDLDPAALTGELLPSWLDDDWVLVEREYLRQRCMVGLEAMCHRLVAVGMPARAVDAGLAAVREEPLRESAHRAVIAAYLAQGNTADVVRHYHRYRELLYAELGLEPSGMMRRLVAGLMPVPHGSRTGE